MVISIVLIVVAVVALTALALASASVRVLREYERGVVFRLGRVIEQRGPGLTLLIPALDRMDERTVDEPQLEVRAAVPHREGRGFDEVGQRIERGFGLPQS